jgi:hypothetical protein
MREKIHLLRDRKILVGLDRLELPASCQMPGCYGLRPNLIEV